MTGLMLLGLSFHKYAATFCQKVVWKKKKRGKSVHTEKY